jgi:hypothetical protein
MVTRQRSMNIGDSQAPKSRKIIFLCLFSTLMSPYAYRLYREESIKRGQASWERAFFDGTLKSPTGPTIPLSSNASGPMFDVSDLGQAIPVDLASDGTLMYKLPPVDDERGSIYRWRHFVRRPDGKQLFVGAGDFCFATDGRIVQVFQSQGPPSGFSIAGVNIMAPEAELSKLGQSTNEPTDRPISSNGTIFATGRLDSHIVSVYDAATQKGYRVPPPPNASEPIWATLLRTIGAARAQSPSDYLYNDVSVATNGSIYATMVSYTNLYPDHMETNCRIAKITNGIAEVLPNPDDFRFNVLTWVTSEGEVIVHRYTECTAFCWPYRHNGKQYEAIPLPAGSRYGRVVGVGSKDKLIVYGTTSRSEGGTRPYLFESGSYFDLLNAIPVQYRKGLEFEYFGNYTSARNFRFRLKNPISRSGHVVALQRTSATTGRLLLLSPKTKSP